MSWLDAAGVPQLKGRAAAKYDSLPAGDRSRDRRQGVALVPHFLAAPDITGGRLVQPFNIERPATSTLVPGHA